MILCADDFGLSPTVSRGILDLASNGKISAVSSLVNYPLEEDEVHELSKLKGKIDIGIHLNLTSGPPILKESDFFKNTPLMRHLPPQLKILLACVMRPYTREVLKKEIMRQFKTFISLYGFSPDHVDSHHHIHQYPVLRNILVEVLYEFDFSGYIRASRFPLRRGVRASGAFETRFLLKSSLLNIFSISSRKLFVRWGFKTNDYLFGGHGPLDKEGIEKMINYYISLEPGERDIFMVHPGNVDELLERRDSLVKERLNIYNCLASERFQKKIFLNRFRYEKNGR